MKKLSARCGFTLPELMTTIAIISILIAIGTPVIQHTLPTIRLRSSAHNIYSTLMLAKAEAMRLGSTVAVRFYNVPNATPPNIIRAFVDDGAGGGIAGDGTINGGERLLTTSFLPDRIIYDQITFINSALIYTPRGIPVRPGGGGGALGAGRVTLCIEARAGGCMGNANGPRYRRTISVSTAGRVQMAEVENRNF